MSKTLGAIGATQRSGAPGNMRTGGQILVDQLRIHGADLAFCVPGESYLAVLDALYDARDEIPLIVCRHESGAANMAEAYGKLTGRPGICFVTRGPGATNASIGVHTAFQDSTPMILFIGQVGRDMIEREAFQEIDFRRMFGQMAKWVAQIDDPERIPEYVARAFQTATSGRPGPVVLALPEDMLTEAAAAVDAARYAPAQAHPGAAEMARLRELLAQAKRPLLIVGGGGWSAPATADIKHFVEANNLPIACAWRRQDSFDNHHPNYIGTVGLGMDPLIAERVKAADLLIVVGPRLGEMTTGGYTLLDVPRPRQGLVHVQPGAEELGRVYQPVLGINASPAHFAAAARTLAPVDHKAWAASVVEARQQYLVNLKHRPSPGTLDMGEVMAELRARLPADAILCNGAGNYAVWAHRFYQFREFGTQLAPTSGAMGYGVPAAVAAKIMHKKRLVICFSGDGCFLMTGQELATAVQYRANVVFLVINNGMYGTIRMHQEREYPGRVSGTDLVNPDFAAYARAFGAQGEIVERTADFAPAFARALAADRPALIELRIDPEAISPRTTLSEIREQALAKAGA
ncbi:MAG: thiamine pyrophosphate-binding protein [Alphaproteobacteria bacterium]|nr:thiamine pyrophosphate-binding protein [Alphaproteobacteria bacterium]